MAVAFSSQNLTQRDRIPYWVDVATQAFFKHGFSARADSFVGNLYADRLGTLGLARCECGPCEVTRTRRDIARDGIDDLILCVRLSGSSHFTQGDREIVVDPGTLLLQDAGRPLKVNFLEQTTSIFVSIPRKAMQARIGNAALANSVSAKAPVAGLAAEFLTMLTARAESLEGPMKARLDEQALDLIVLALTAEGGSPAPSSPRTTALMRLKTVIDTRLSDPNLKPEEAAAAAGISVRYANVLLAEEDFSVERYILHRRLERCRRALEDPLQIHRMIGEIAYSWGFSDHSHFTRRFRAAFGITPGDCRRQLQDRRNA
jgi:AraC family transcriptional regulator, positive regulator of tynA and feaB